MFTFKHFNPIIFIIFLSSSLLAQASTQNSITINIKLPVGGVIVSETVMEGGSYNFTGFPSPIDFLNGGSVDFPEGCLTENITVDVEIPDFASIGFTSVDFGEEIASAIRFSVTPDDSSGEVSPYNFSSPAGLTIPLPADIPSALGEDIENYLLAYRNDDGSFDTTGVRTTLRDAVLGIISAELSHFSDVVLTSEIVLDGIVGVAEDKSARPENFKLSQNYPNPFNPSTTIKYEVPEKSHINLTIYDISGKSVLQLINNVVNAGRYKITWDATNYPSGIYIYRLKTGKFIDSKKMILIK